MLLLLCYPGCVHVGLYVFAPHTFKVSLSLSLLSFSLLSRLSSVRSKFIAPLSSSVLLLTELSPWKQSDSSGRVRLRAGGIRASAAELLLIGVLSSARSDPSPSCARPLIGWPEVEHKEEEVVEREEEGGERLETGGVEEC